jgi:hypothetical protein
MTLTLILTFYNHSGIDSIGGTVGIDSADMEYKHIYEPPLSIETLEPLYRRVLEDYHHLIFDESIIMNGIYSYSQLIDKLAQLRDIHPMPKGSYLGVIEKLNSGCPEMCEQIIYEYILGRMLDLKASWVEIVRS